MSRPSRRGTESLSNALLAVVIFGISMIVVMMIYIMLFSFGKEQFTIEECQASLLLTRAADLNKNALCVAPIDNPVPLKCTRKFLTVESDGVKEDKGLSDYDYNCPEGFSSPSCVGHAVIAQEMAACWDLFFNGEKIVFQQMEKKLGDFGPRNSACFVCGEITLRTDVQRFSEYAKLARYEDVTYYDHFNTRKAMCAKGYFDEKQACWDTYATEQTPPIDQDTFRKDEKYAIVFIRKGMGSCMDESPEPGDSEVTFTVQAVPADKVSSYCDVVMV